MKRLLTIALVAMIIFVGADAWAQTCGYDEDCYPEEICDQGYCVVPVTVVPDGTCYDDVDCLSGDYCNGGYCATAETVIVGPEPGVTVSSSCTVSGGLISAWGPSAVVAALLLLFFGVVRRFRRSVGEMKEA